MSASERELLAVQILKSLDGQLTDPEFAELEQRLRTDPEAVRFYCELAQIDGALPHALAQFPPGTAAAVAAEPHRAPVPHATSARRQFAVQWRGLAAGLLLGALLCGAGFRSVVAGQREQLQQLVGTLQQFRDYVQQFVGAFQLALDTDREPGPTALVAGYDRLVVAGAVDPQIIQKVEIDWGIPGAVETIDLTRPHSAKDQLVRLHASRRYPVQSGLAYTVVVRAVPWESQRATIESLQRGENWLERSSSFLGTSQGLVPMQNLPVALQLVGGQRIVADELTIEGTAFAEGSLALLFTTSEGRRHVLLPPTPVLPGRAVSVPKLPFDYANGTGLMDVVFSPLSPVDWPSDFQQPSAALFPESFDFDAMSPGTRRWPIAVTVDLLPIERRVAERVFELGGSVKIHTQAQECRSPADFPEGRFQIQTIILNDTPVRDLRFLRRLKFLQGLQLSNTSVDDAALKGIHKDLPGLIWIILSGSQITDETIEQEVAKCPQTAFLSIGLLPQLSNRSIEAIANNLTNLTDLTMDDSNVSSILPLARLSKLSRLQIQRSRVPEAEFAELQRLRPDLKIIR
jgi:hypothetical protein